MCRIVLLVVFLGVCAFAGSTSVAPSPLPSQATDSLIASMPFTPPNPYESLEQIPPSQFQDVVVRYDRLKALSEDKAQPKNVRDFARAAQFFYKEQWDSAYFAYDSLRGRDALLDGSVILRMAKCLFKLRDYKNMRVVLGLYKNLDQDASFDRVASRLRIEAAMADTTLSDRAHADSLKVFVEKYPKSDDAAALRYRYAQYLEQFKQMKEAKRINLRLLTSASNYKDSAFAAIRRLRKVRGAPETLEEKVAYAKMACAKDNANECLTLLDSIRILDSVLVSLSPEAALPPPEDSLQKKLAPSSLDMNTRIALWEKRAVTLRTLKRDDESIKQFKFLLDSVEARPLWMQSILRLYRNNAGRYEKEIRKMDATLQDANQFSKENANNLWVKGFEYEQKEQYDSAIVCYKTLSHKRFKNNIKRQWAKFRIGFVYFKQNKNIHRLIVNDKKTGNLSGFITYETVFEYFIENYYSEMTEFNIPLKQINLVINNVITLNKNETLHKCMETFYNKGISMLPILDDDGKIFGYFYLKDIIYFFSMGEKFNFNNTVENFLKDLYEDVDNEIPYGKRRIKELNDNTSLKNVFEEMSTSPERKLIIKNSDSQIGIIALYDIFKKLVI